MKVLFVAGPGRSGTTAFANYLNQHRQVLVCRERYKFIQDEITPDLFTFERILDYREGETNLPREHHEDLLAKKDEDALEWVGDKTPSYVRSMGNLAKNNPGARFVVLYRPVEEVAESYDARSKNPEDGWLGGKNGFEIGVRDWNIAMKKTRQFVESGRSPEVLVVSYHDFFGDSEASIPLVSRFLELDFDDSVREAWSKMSRSFEGRRRKKEPLNEEQARYIQENKDFESEGWILDRIQKQYKDHELPFKKAVPREAGQRSAEQETKPGDPDPRQLKQRIVKLERRLADERQSSKSLEARLRSLEGQVKEMRSSSVFRMLQSLDRLKRRVLKR
ncbi:MAG: sulfotransferase [Acidobacteria bacterium]|nr:sulfotransferase [Acidobacteriota bacterium]